MKKHANTPTNEVNHFYCFRMITKSIVSPYHDWNPRSVIYNIHTWYLWSKIVPISFSSFSCIIVCRKRPSTPPPSPSHCMQTNDVCRSPLEIRRRSHLYILLYYTFFFFIYVHSYFLYTPSSSSLYTLATWREWSLPFMLTTVKHCKTAHDYFILSERRFYKYFYFMNFTPLLLTYCYQYIVNISILAIIATRLCFIYDTYYICVCIYVCCRYVYYTIYTLFSGLKCKIQ